PQEAGELHLLRPSYKRKPSPERGQILNLLQGDNSPRMSLDRRLVLRGCFALGVLATEALDTSRGINQLLLAGEEGVAGSADFNRNIAFVGRASGEGVAARAMYANLVVNRMNTGFHDLFGPRLQSFDSTGVGKDSARSGAFKMGGLCSRQNRLYPQAMHR